LSAFAVVYERSNKPADPAVLERMMKRLSHRGPDGSDISLSGHVAMGHWHFWTTPEEVGETQPLQIDDMPFEIVFDGRIDNRSELFSKLNISEDEGAHLSDAALVLYAYARWSEHCFEHFIGEFALVIFDERNHQLICARDQLGDRTLFFSSNQSRLVIASEPWAVAGADGLKPEINDKAVAHYFAFRAPEDGQTMFNGIFELLPAHVMLVGDSRERKWRYWHPDPTKKIRYNTDEEYATHFLSLLEESVRCRMRSTTPVGILMSGGLDSTSVASLAARILKPGRLTTISYVFDELPDCDEREYINAVKERWNINSIQIPCDDLWPYKDWKNWPHNSNQPEGNPYRALKERAYRRACDEGIQVLLTGGFGDHLYDGAEDWMFDLFKYGFPLRAIKGFVSIIRFFGLWRALSARSLRQIIKRILAKFNGNWWLRRKNKPYPWLTTYSISKLDQFGSWIALAFRMKSNLLGLIAAQSSSGEIINANRYTLDLRHPYRDRRLIEFILAIPAYQLYNESRNKYILRVAMKKILPEEIRLRSQPTSLISLFSRGARREKKLLLSSIENPFASWDKYIDTKWLNQNWNNQITPETDGPHALIPWFCLSYEIWLQNKSYVKGEYVEQ